MTGAELREEFLKYFEARGHSRVESSSLVPSGDATLLFTNAGMVQFKSVFTGQEHRPYKRAVSAQKCLRVSGKHNDLENVGHTARHHTFFEMLGNFSFGDYFKEDAIAFGWDFLTKTLGLPKKLLHVTIFMDDDPADEIWKKVLGSESNPIIRLGEKDNFWSMGDTGPCGPCSEVHIDQGERLGCGSPNCGPDCDCDRFLELWNLVFMQYERDSSGNLEPLPKPSIDTGLGLERLAAVIQGKNSNWDSDIFEPIIYRIEQISGKSRESGPDEKVAIRVIADHSRSAAFLIADGVLPSNEGRGYVLRRIMRRALRYGKRLGLDEPFLFDTASVVVSHMSQAYPELDARKALIREVIVNEEERFLQTLTRGLTLFEEEINQLSGSGKKLIPGRIVFRLYDTFGFPKDLTEDLAKEAGMEVDHDGFRIEMAKQKEMARQSWEGTGGHVAAVPWEAIADLGAVEFTGYQKLEDTGAVIAILRAGHRADQIDSGEVASIITDRTPFYGESGGQVGDHGIITSADAEFEVQDTTRVGNGLVIHQGSVKSGSFSVGGLVGLRVSRGLRRSTMANHSATHLLQWALRTVLGEHVNQRGSLVETNRLRFDFTHFSAISDQELQKVENLVNEKILEDIEISVVDMPIERAIEIGATALFGEKYGSTVRVVSVGDFSVELCGGTHASRTGEIGLFKIVSEGGIAAGVRRIEAVTGMGVITYLRSLKDEITQVAERLKSAPGEIVKKLDRFIEEKKAKEKEISDLKQKLSNQGFSNIESNSREINGINVLAYIVEDAKTPKELREYADRVKDRLKSGIALLGAKSDGKAFILALVTKDLTDRFHAGNIVKMASESLGGSGGGRPDMAQAGGPNGELLADTIRRAEKFIFG
ncbi:MAG: alanine--tRNA ligase [Pseudomonadota bacterium]